MKILIFGLTITSSWGNGHATIWRGLCKALVKRGHRVMFFEKNTSYYSDARDTNEIPGMEIILYDSWEKVKKQAEKELKDADAGIITSYCQDALDASELLRNSNALKIFYDLDSPVTIKNLETGGDIFYIPPEGLINFDVVFSYSGGEVLTILAQKFGAKNVHPLYGCVDPETHYPVKPEDSYRSFFSYLGTYSEDRQLKLQELFFEPASLLQTKQFLLGGSMYPFDISLPQNIYHLQHIAPQEHPAFYCSSEFTLNITRSAMAENGYSPSGRLFEAASCGVPIISDYWEGLDQFFSPGKEIIIVKDRYDVVEALRMPEYEKNKIREAAREKVLALHTCYKRIEEFEKVLERTFAARSLICGE